MAPAVIEPVISQFLAQRLNRCATAVPYTDHSAKKMDENELKMLD